MFNTSVFFSLFLWGFMQNIKNNKILNRQGPHSSKYCIHLMNNATTVEHHFVYVSVLWHSIEMSVLAKKDHLISRDYNTMHRQKPCLPVSPTAVFPSVLCYCTVISLLVPGEQLGLHTTTVTGHLQPLIKGLLWQIIPIITYRKKSSDDANCMM